MSVESIPSPFNLFSGTDGKALENGFVFVGEENKDPETNEITVYWDSALTQPAVQPIRTTNGYLFRGGSAARIYAGTAYSITVKDKQSKIVFTSLSDNVFTDSSVTPFLTVALMVADRGLVVGQSVLTGDYFAGTGGGNRYEIVAAGTGTADGFSFIDVTGPDTPVQARALFFNEIRNVRQAGAIGSGTETTEFQAAIDSFASDEGHYQIFVPTGAYTVGTLTEGSRNITWMLQSGATVTQGQLPGAVLKVRPESVSAPQSVWVFGEDHHTFENVQIVSAASIGSGATSGTLTGTVNGISSNDRLVATPRISDHTDGLIAYAFDPSGLNTFAVRYWNPTAGNIAPGTRTFTLVIAKNDSYRQVFALSPYLGKDCVLAGVDMEATKSACIFKTSNAGSSWVPKFALDCNEIRRIIEITENTDTDDNDVLDTVLLALVSDAGVAAELAYRSADGGETWTAITFTLSGANAEALLYSADVEGGEGSGGSRIVAGAGRGSSADCTVFLSTDIGVSFGSPIVVDAAAAYDGAWYVRYLSGSGGSSVWLVFVHQEIASTSPPAVYKSTDGGATWSSISTVGANGDNWQGVIELSTGTFLAGIDDSGKVYRSTDSAATWTLVFTATDIASAETKMRNFFEAPDGTIYGIGQNSGYVWISVDDGLTWYRSERCGNQFGPISIAGTNDFLLIGGGQGLNTSTGCRAEVYRSMATSFNDSE